jgi:hypothetical protein
MPARFLRTPGERTPERERKIVRERSRYENESGDGMTGPTKQITTGFTAANRGNLGEAEVKEYLYKAEC